MADNFGGSENIFYIDDGNIVLIDPNSITDSNDLAKITEKNDISDENGKTKPPTKVANVQELLDLGFIKGVSIDSPPSFI